MDDGALRTSLKSCTHGIDTSRNTTHGRLPSGGISLLVLGKTATIRRSIEQPRRQVGSGENGRDLDQRIHQPVNQAGAYRSHNRSKTSSTRARHQPGPVRRRQETWGPRPPGCDRNHRSCRIEEEIRRAQFAARKDYSQQHLPATHTRRRTLRARTRSHMPHAHPGQPATYRGQCEHNETTCRPLRPLPLQP